MVILLFLAACFLAYSNGANDNFKGVATLFGSGTTNYKTALWWATITTFLGSVTAIFLAEILVKNFSGKGLVPDQLLQGPEFAIAVAFGAGLTVFIASKVGMPISTTHSLVGALLGSGVVAVGSAFNFSMLGNSFLIPLLLSPLMAAGLSFIFYLIFRKSRQTMGFTKETCVCIGEKFVPISKVTTHQEGVVAATIVSQLSVKVASPEQCVEVYEGRVLGFKLQGVLDALHFFSAGVVSFARGLNDTPKIAGLLLAAQAFNITWGISAIAVAIAVGGLLNARKVGMTVGANITRMNHGQGFTANLITGLLVTTASVHGLPVSTTHVSIGAIFGIGTVTRKLNTRVVSSILLSWVLTLPIAAIMAGTLYWLFMQL